MSIGAFVEEKQANPIRGRVEVMRVISLAIPVSSICDAGSLKKMSDEGYQWRGQKHKYGVPSQAEYLTDDADVYGRSSISKVILSTKIIL